MKTKLLLCSILFAGLQALSTTTLHAQCHAGYTFTVNANTVSFTNTSTGGAANQFYLWNFGDGNYDYAQDPSHSFQHIGTYMVCLEMGDSTSSCYSIFCDSVVITVGCNPISVVGTGTNPSGPASCDGSIKISAPIGGTAPYGYTWWPNVSNSSSASNLCGGSYDITVTDAKGCTGMTSIYIQDSSSTGSCNANFTSTVNGSLATFTNTSTGGTGTTTYLWNFGDGSSMYGSSTVSHSYYNGTYLACLFMSDSIGGCWSSFCDTVIITNGNNPPCNANFVYSIDSMQQNGVWFHDYSSGTPVNWSWNFGDGSTSTLQNPLHQYAQVGTYSVCLTVVNSLHETCTYCNVVHYYHCNLVAGFTSSSANDPQIAFTNSSTGGYAPNYSWDFGDGSYSSSVNATHVYQYNGMYGVCLIAYDSTNSNCWSSHCDTIVITHATPILCNASIYLYQDSAVTSDPLLWYVYSSVIGTAPFTYLWNFGDGTTSTQQYPSHTYAAAGHYNICLTITDATGCTSSTCDSTYKFSSPGKSPSAGIIKNIVVVNPLAGIEENTASVSSIFPNPANDMLELTLSKVILGELNIADMMGREVYQEKINNNHVRINVSNLQVGYYNLSIVSGEKVLHEKVMIAR